jgi:hypothetical protein
VIRFTFRVDHTGVFSESWVLTTTPRASINADENGRASSLKKSVGSCDLFLLAMSTAEDQNAHLRSRLRSMLENQLWKIQVRDIVTDILREVRTPRREEEIVKRELAGFEKANRWRGLHYDRKPYQQFSGLYNTVRRHVLQISADQGSEEGDHEEIMPSQWDASVDSIFRGLSDMVKASHRPDLVAIDGFKIVKVPETLAAHPIKKEEADAFQVGSQGHDLTVEDSMAHLAIELSTELRLLVGQCSIRPLASQCAAAREVVASIAESIVRTEAKAREAARLDASVLVPALLSPFSPEGGEAWATMLQRETERTEAPPPDPKAKGKEVKKEAKPPKGKANAEETPAGPTQAQIDQYHVGFYKSLTQELGSIVDKVVDAAFAADRAEAEAFWMKHTVSVASKATLRQTDIEGRRVILQVDLNVAEDMILSTDGMCWVLPERARVKPWGVFAAAVQSIRAVLDWHPAALLVTSRLEQPHRAQTAVNEAGMGVISPSAVGKLEDEVTAPRLSLADLTAVLAAAVDVPIQFIAHIPGAPMSESEVCGEGVYLLEHLGSESLVDPLDPPPILLSDDEDERLPTFEPERIKKARIRQELKASDNLRKPTVGRALSDIFDILITDDPEVWISGWSTRGAWTYNPLVHQGCLDANSPWVDFHPSAEQVLAGITLHNELNTISYFMERVQGPRLAIIGGDRLDERLKAVDSLIDMVSQVKHAKTRQVT